MGRATIMGIRRQDEDYLKKTFSGCYFVIKDTLYMRLMGEPPREGFISVVNCFNGERQDMSGETIVSPVEVKIQVIWPVQDGNNPA